MGFEIHIYLTLGGDKLGLVSKLGMKDAFTFHFILDPSVAKRCKGTSVDIETTLKDVPFLN